MSSTDNKFVKFGHRLINYQQISEIRCDSKECTIYWHTIHSSINETIKKKESFYQYEDVKKLYDAEMNRLL